MAHRIPATFAFVSLMLLVHGVRPVPATACGSEPGPTVDVADVPANGVVVIAFRCPATPCFEGAVPEVLSVVDTLTGEEIAGEVLQYFEGDVSWTEYVRWLPHAPLVAGSSYEVLWRPSSFYGPFYSEDYAFQALPEARFDVRGASFAAEMSLANDFLQAVVCESFAVLNDCGGITVSTALGYRTLLGRMNPISLCSGQRELTDVVFCEI